MNNSNPSALPCLCFAQIYEDNIEHKLKEIDIFLKTTPSPYKLSDISALLHIELNELTCIIQHKNITILNMVTFFTVIQTASSYICKLIQREWEYHNVKHYTPEAISYIYELNPEKVRLAFEQSGLTHVDSSNIKELFRHIQVPVMNL